MIVQYNHESYEILGENVVSVGDLRRQLLQHFGLPSVSIVDHGKLLKDDSLSLSQLSEGVDTKLVVFGAKETVDKDFKVDPLLKDDFCQPVTRKIKRKLNTRDRLAGPISYGFQAVQTLTGLHSEKKARKILNSLANDPGILAVMKNNEWLVSELCEMYPEGYVGVSEVCVLGLNENKGQRIKLRIRTDDLSGFRKYLSIKKVLYHELAHNVHSDHNSDFFMLMREIEREANALDWTQTHGNVLSVGSVAHGSEEDSEPDFDDSDNDVGGGHKLGGATQIISAVLPPRAMAGAAAVTRLQRSFDQHKPMGEGGDEMIVDRDQPEMLTNSGHNEMEVVSDHLSTSFASVERKSSADNIIENLVDGNVTRNGDNEQREISPAESSIPAENIPSQKDIVSSQKPVIYAADLMEIVGAALDVPISMLAVSDGMQASLEKAVVLKEAAVHLLFEIEEMQQQLVPSTYHAAIKVLLTICTNAKDRTESKYRHIKKTSGSFIRNLKPYTSAVTIMKAAGFVETDEEFRYERNDIGLLYIFCSCLELILGHLSTDQTK